jgi:hypothetical protein
LLVVVLPALVVAVAVPLVVVAALVAAALVVATLSVLVAGSDDSPESQPSVPSRVRAATVVNL